MFGAVGRCYVALKFLRMPRGRKRKEEITSSVGGDVAAEAEVKKSSEESPAKKRKGSDNNMTFKIEHCKS